jgi:hypothetical protein
LEYIKESKQASLLLYEISTRSKMPGVSKEFAALDKAEEELVECLMEVRKLKSHFNEIKITRKKLNFESRKKVIDNLIEEIGDIFVDVFIGIPSVIPEIDYYAIDARIKYKLKKYKKIIDMLNNYNIKRGYDIESTAAEETIEYPYLDRKLKFPIIKIKS